MSGEGVYLAFDVGGTFIKAGAFDASGRIVEPTLRQYDARADGSADELIEHFASIISDIARCEAIGPTTPIVGVGYAFPGPFDYERGISYMRGLNKFDALYGIHLGERLLNALIARSDIAERLGTYPLLRFENDASLFAIGESGYGQAVGRRRAICFTIGTGLGSGFVEDGRLVSRRCDVPENGWAFQVPYRSRIADDYISRRGLLELAAELGIERQGRDVRQLADAAFAGEAVARSLFDAFGVRMADVLRQTIETFEPDVVVLGGQISKSGELFVPSFAKELERQGVHTSVVCSRDTPRSTFMGIYQLLRNPFGGTI